MKGFLRAILPLQLFFLTLDELFQYVSSCHSLHIFLKQARNELTQFQQNFLKLLNHKIY